MRELAALVGVVAASLLLIGVAVFAGGDRQLFVPVPEAQAEGFMREVATRRFDLAMKYLSADKRRTETPHALAAQFATLLEGTGEVNMVNGEPGWISGDRAAAKATVVGDDGSVLSEFSLVREDGLWKISGVTVGSR